MQANHLDGLTVARQILRAGGPAALATLAADGAPFASHVISAAGQDGTPILLLSDLAVHTGNIRRDARASLLLVRSPAAPDGAAERLTLVGLTVDHPDQADAGATFLRRHPEARRYSSLADFRFYRFKIEFGHVVAGFGVIARFTGTELLENPAPPK